MILTYRTNSSNRTDGASGGYIAVTRSFDTPTPDREHVVITLSRYHVITLSRYHVITVVI